ncbi:MAG TPA: MarR family transcriptional regulator [Pseudonocardiaceae bacterium]|nr:MarR family transcriptional regulator [Pseudonocardiaceae bacterium]
MSRREQELLSSAALIVFRLNGQFLDLAEQLARPAGITAAWWQVLGAVIDGPLTVSDIGRSMGISRQAVQRIADLLVGKGLAEYHDNPAHRRAKLVALTDAGRAANAAISPQHAQAAARLVSAMGAEELANAVAAMTKLSEVLDSLA